MRKSFEEHAREVLNQASFSQYAIMWFVVNALVHP